MYNYEKIMELNKELGITFSHVAMNPDDVTSMSDVYTFIKGNNVINIPITEMFECFNLFCGTQTFLFNKQLGYITNTSDLKPYIKRVVRIQYKINGIPAQRVSSNFEFAWNNAILEMNKSKLHLISFNESTKQLVAVQEIKNASVQNVDLKSLIKSGPTKYIDNLSYVKDIIDKYYNKAAKEKEIAENNISGLRNTNEKNTKIFDAIKEVISKCANEYGISTPYNDTGASYSIKHTFISKGDAFDYETTNTVSISMNPKTIKIRYSFWVDSDTFNNEKVVEKTVPFKKIDSKDKMRKLIEQIIKSLKKESR